MGRITNKDKWDAKMTIINDKIDSYIKGLSLNIPDKFYLINRIGKIDECFTNRIYCSISGLYFYGKNPTKLDVESITNISNNLKLDDKEIYVEYKYQWGNNHWSSTTIKIDEFENSDKVFLTLEEAKPIAEKIENKIKERREFLETHKKDKDYNYSANGYKFLGWQNCWRSIPVDSNLVPCSESGNPTYCYSYPREERPEYFSCLDQKHILIEVSHNQRGSEHSVSCPKCKVYWKYDSSD